MPIEEARKLGAMSLFGEKYGDKVRVVKFGSSIEFCGGTHVKATGNIGFFKIVSESSVSAGVRRIEAVTADMAEKMVSTLVSTLKDLGEALKGSKDLRKSIEQLVQNNAKLQQRAETMMTSIIAAERESLKRDAQMIGNRALIVAEVKPIFVEKLKDLAYQLRGEYDEAVIVLGCVAEGKPQLLIIITDNLVKDLGLNAGQTIRDVAKFIQGGGGGQPFFATAGGKNAEGMEAALREAKYFFSNKLNG